MQRENRQTYETVNLSRRVKKRVTEDKGKKREEKSSFKVRALQEMDESEGGEGRR